MIKSMADSLVARKEKRRYSYRSRRDEPHIN